MSTESLQRLAERVSVPYVIRRTPGDVTALVTTFCEVVDEADGFDIWNTPTDPRKFNVTESEAIAALNGSA